MFEIKYKIALFGVVLFIVRISGLAIGTEINEPNYVELFNNDINHFYKFISPYAGLQSFNPCNETPRGDQNYIAFLADILRNGPSWLPEHKHHFAKCYAVMCLGATKSPEALEPLLEAIDMEDDPLADKREHISAYAIMALGCLGDTNAVGPLIDALKSEKEYISSRVPSALSKIGDFRAIGPMIKILEEQQKKWNEANEMLKNTPDSPEDINTRKIFLTAKINETEARSKIFTSDQLLAEITKVNFNTEYKSAKDLKAAAKMELSKKDVNILPELWSQWWRGGPQFTRGRFEAKHSEWKAMKKENRLEKSNANSKLSEMADLGIPAIPFMVEKIGHGETDFIPLISKLTNKELAETATKEQCLDWWKTNKQKWLIPFPEPNKK
jgi:hypothetical protein